MSDIRIDMQNRIPVWFAYSKESIESSAPTDPGIYFIVRIKHKTMDTLECIYIGQAKDIKDRLLRHVGGTSEKSSCLNINHAVAFGFIAPIKGGEKRRRTIEDQFIKKYKPICNEE